MSDYRIDDEGACDVARIGVWRRVPTHLPGNARGELMIEFPYSDPRSRERALANARLWVAIRESRVEREAGS